MLYHCFKTNDQTRPRRPAPRPAQLRTPATTCVRTTRGLGAAGTLGDGREHCAGRGHRSSFLIDK